MSIVTWDGLTFVTDRMGTNSDMPHEQTKSLQYNQQVVAWTGDIGPGLALAAWFTAGGPDGVPYFPVCQNDKERWCRLIVASLGSVFYYEQEPYPIQVSEKFMAWGSGSLHAIGAMAMGANAEQAARIACRYNVYCGIALDVYDLKTLTHERKEL